MTREYDAVVIGSGMGGLTTASLLARFGKKRVLVLERHFKLGGFTHSFQRHGYVWDVGVHYVGEMYPQALARRIMDLVTDGGVQWQPMGNVLERYIFPDAKFEVPNDPKVFEARLTERFPAEATEIRRYFKSLSQMQGWIARWFVGKQYPRWAAHLLTMSGRRKAMSTTAAELDRFQDPLLKAILAGQWPDFGTTPHESAFGLHATVAADYLHGGFYPIGGSGKIAAAAKEVIEHHGGKCLVNHPVEQIDIENGKAVGVTVVHKGERISYRAKHIISNAGAVATFGKLVAKEVCHREREQAARLKRGVSAVILFLGLKDDPRNHGFDDANYWIYDRLDHDAHARIRDGEERRTDGAFLSFGSLRDPEATKHTAQIISFDSFAPWSSAAQGEWKKRGHEYDSMKEAMTEQLLDFVEKRQPGIRQLIDYAELSTPETVRSFTGFERGMIYGQLCDVDRLGDDQWSIKTSLKNLWLTGSDVGTPGVNGALMAGVMTAAKLLGPLGLPRIMIHAFFSKPA